MALKGYHMLCSIEDCSVDGNHCEEDGEPWPCRTVREMRQTPGQLPAQTPRRT